MVDRPQDFTGAGPVADGLTAAELKKLKKQQQKQPKDKEEGERQKNQKPLLMLKCLKKAADLDGNDPYLHVCRIKFLKYEETATFSGVVGDLVKETSSQLFPINDPAVLNENFKNDNVNSLRHRLA
ncbi:hypothetical protein OSTOST_22470, partial [Ostertagia ostertagi]